MPQAKQNNAVDHSAFAESYKKKIDEIRAVPDAELAEHNVNINGSVTTILGALPEIMALRPEIAKMPQIDQKLLTPTKSGPISADPSGTQGTTSVGLDGSVPSGARPGASVPA